MIWWKKKKEGTFSKRTFITFLEKISKKVRSNPPEEFFLSIEGLGMFYEITIGLIFS